MTFLEAVLALMPADAGGRTSSVSPRDGSYRPFAVAAGGERLRIRVIEGPPTIAPGGNGSVVAELETPVRVADLIAGMELDLIEHDRRVGILMVTRLCRPLTA